MAGDVYGNVGSKLSEIEQPGPDEREAVDVSHSLYVVCALGVVVDVSFMVRRRHMAGECCLLSLTLRSVVAVFAPGPLVRFFVLV
jgi:hypothetical protein